MDSDSVVRGDWIKLHVHGHELDNDAGCIGGTFTPSNKNCNFIELCDYYSSYWRKTACVSRNRRRVEKILIHNIVLVAIFGNTSKLYHNNKKLI